MNKTIYINNINYDSSDPDNPLVQGDYSDLNDLLNLVIEGYYGKLDIEYPIDQSINQSTIDFLESLGYPMEIKIGNPDIDKVNRVILDIPKPPRINTSNQAIINDQKTELIKIIESIYSAIDSGESEVIINYPEGYELSPKIINIITKAGWNLINWPGKQFSDDPRLIIKLS